VGQVGAHPEAFSGKYLPKGGNKRVKERKRWRMGKKRNEKKEEGEREEREERKKEGEGEKGRKKEEEANGEMITCE
tara:strand:- start:974 stop:1201 length:228 start_codon:yes stop_codon:yes gene_type:complete